MEGLHLIKEGGDVAPDGIKEALAAASVHEEEVPKVADERARHGDLRGTQKGGCPGCGLLYR